MAKKDINVSVITGRLTADVAFYPSKNDPKTGIARFSVAVNRRVKDGENWKDVPTYLDVISYKMTEGFKNTLVKGTPVSVTGELIDDSYTNKENVKIRRTAILASNIVLCGNKPEKAAEEQSEPAAQQDEDDLPF